VLAFSPLWGRLRLIAKLHDPVVIRKILAHLALCHTGRVPAPAPPNDDKAVPARMPQAGHDRKGKKVSFRRRLRRIFPPDSSSLSTCLTVLFLSP
jgi:hypothetical protein